MRERLNAILLWCAGVVSPEHREINKAWDEIQRRSDEIDSGLEHLRSLMTPEQREKLRRKSPES